jgi:hypothetical protein
MGLEFSSINKAVLKYKCLRIKVITYLTNYSSMQVVI